MAPVLCRPPGRERGEAGYEEMQPREGDLEKIRTRMKGVVVTMLTESFRRCAVLAELSMFSLVDMDCALQVSPFLPHQPLQTKTHPAQRNPNF